MSARPVLIMAGGTGGHVYPALAVANVLGQRQRPVVWLGSPGGIEERVSNENALPFEPIPMRGLRGHGIGGWLLGPFRTFGAVLKAIAIIRRRQPSAVLGMGGYASAPGGIAAWLLRRPLIIHEQNAIAGLTNRLLARFARVVLTAFPGSFSASKKVRRVGNPVRHDIVALPTPEQRYRDRNGALNLLILGGSLGAFSLNSAVPAAIAKLGESDRPNIWHQTGSKTHSECVENYRSLQVEARVDAFVDDMAQAYAWADLVICRAGALTIAEITAAGVAAILVPYPHAVDDHQTANAQELVQADAALLLADQELGTERILATMQALGADRASLLNRASRARALHRGDAAARIADVCEELGGGTDD